jgi:hypothetical protein
MILRAQRQGEASRNLVWGSAHFPMLFRPFFTLFNLIYLFYFAPRFSSYLIRGGLAFFKACLVNRDVRFVNEAFLAPF